MKPEIELMGFMDVFYSYDNHQPENGRRQDFLFHHNRHNEFNLNLGLIQLAVDHSKYRAKLAFQSGTYANDNYAAEEDVFQHINQANVGISLDKKNKLWLDAGIFDSNLGFESALSIYNPTLTRSLAAENSPYFLAGAKLNYTPNDQWSLTALISNGWQRIKRVQGNSLPSFGTQLIYSTNKSTLNWSTFIGTDDPDEFRRMRYFNNLYWIFKLHPSLTLTAGMDIGLQEKSASDDELQHWLVPTLIVQYEIDNRWKAALRIEHFEDKEEIILTNPVSNLIDQITFNGPLNIGSTLTGVSLNLDYSPIKTIAWRTEVRWLSSDDIFFMKDNFPEDSNLFITTSLSILIKGKIKNS